MARRAGLALWADLHNLGIDLWEVLEGVDPSTDEDKDELAAALLAGVLHTPYFPGRHSAAEAWAVAETLPDTSRTRAAMAGDPDLMGWGFDRELAVAQHNLTIELLRTVPSWKKTPTIPHLESPTIKVRAQQETVKRREQMSTNRGVMAAFGM